MAFCETITALRSARPCEQTMTPYHPLNDNEIRLLQICPGVGDDLLRCSFVHQDLNDTELRYTAISYPWGPPEDPHHQCYIDGHELTIRNNAFTILIRLRRPHEAVKVWIDCLCIKQNDKPEKVAQIKLMHQIYRRASRTIIWLGPANQASDEAVKWINSLDVDHIYQEFVAGWQSRWKYSQKSFILDLLADNPRRSVLFNAVADLFFAVYWSRVWIRQEAAVGGNPHLLWGHHEMSWKTVAVLAWIYRPRHTIDWPDEYWPHADKQYHVAESVTETILSIDAFRSGASSMRPDSRVISPLFAQMVWSRSGSTTKAHDKLYAMISMCSDGDRLGYGQVRFLEPDYSLSWQEVYTGIARFFFDRFDAACDLLNHAGMIYQGASSDLPSWVPDWRYPTSSQILASESWGAGGALPNVRIKAITLLSKKQRSQLLSYGGYASILPLCGQLPRDRCKATESKAYVDLEPKETLSAELMCADTACKDKISKAEYTYLESASRAALVLEIRSCMQDKISYIARRSGWSTEIELSQHRRNILSIDQENLNFLDKAQHERVDGLYIDSKTLKKAYDWTLITAQDSESADATDDLVDTADEWRAWLADDTIDHLATRPPYHSAIESAFTFRDWRFAYTESGYMCLVPPLCELGDKVCILNGYTLPFVLRPTVQEWHVLLGPCYVHGMMKGIALELMEEFMIKVDEKSGSVVVKRPQGDIRQNGKKMPAGRYMDILETLGDRWVKLI